MGIEGLYKFINKNCPNVYNLISIFDIKDNSCIIDGMQHIYTQLIYMRSKGKEVITPDGINISHIHGLINSLTYYSKYGIIPIFIFDGKSPDIKKKKVEERRQNLKNNLNKLKDLENLKNDINENIKNIKGLDHYHSDENNTSESSDISDNSDTDGLALTSKRCSFTDFDPDINIISQASFSPIDNSLLDEELKKISDIQDEYKKVYKRSIILKNYYIKDWITILELLGLPVIKAEGEADPLCAYISKNNKYIYGIISDDSDMLAFGTTRLMRKSINQQFTVIELEILLDSITKILNDDFRNIRSFSSVKNYKFTSENLIEFSILLGTDYANFNLLQTFPDTVDLLKCYMYNGLASLVREEDMEKFNIIKKYYQNNDFTNNFDHMLEKPEWKKPKLMELKQKLLKLGVEEEYIDKNNELFDYYFNKYTKRLNSRNIEIDNNIDIFQDINGFNDFNEINSYKKYNNKYSIQNNTIRDDFEALTSSLTISLTNNNKNIIDPVNEYENFMNDIVSYSEDLPNNYNYTKPIKIIKNLKNYHNYNSNNTNFQQIYLSNSCPENNYYKPKQYISRNRSNSGSNTNIFDI
jgi:5'-3' exonuclease